MVHRRLFIQNSKTELYINYIYVCDVNISSVNTVNNLRTWFDIHMSMDIHVGKVVSKAFRSLNHIR
jgi:hypothetical protein